MISEVLPLVLGRRPPLVSALACVLKNSVPPVKTSMQALEYRVRFPVSGVVESLTVTCPLA